MSPAFDVIVIGLGAIGSAAARELARRGARVLGIDRWAPPHAMGSTHGETRIIREIYFEDPLYVPLLQRAYTLWETLEAECGERLFTPCGGLMIGAPESALIRGTRESAARYGLPAQEFDARTLASRFPQFELPAHFVALLDPRAGYLDPERAVAAQLAGARAAGAAIHTDERVLSWARDGDGIRVTTERGRYHAAQVIIAAGAWTRALIAPTRALPLTGERQTLVWFDAGAARDRFAADRFPIWICEFEDGQAIYGFPDQPRGWKAAVHHAGGPIDDPDTIERAVTAADLARVRGGVARLFSWVAHAPVNEAAICSYTDTPDLHFLIDRLPEEPRVLVTSACSGHGFKFAGAIGELQAQLILGETPTFDPAPFRLARFGASAR
ncbi:MAG: N-methyl-L-tryptophan oxidase [Gemmatimonadaceae bacterium]|nr:N-methyl-L-tryptophan oxidase [Gemmatimonadaceae bacterium]